MPEGKFSMRQGQQNKRMRGRNRKGPNPLTRSYESNGGDVKLRGTALHIAEKYVQLARDSQSSGDRVAAENYFQHAEHYYRIVAAAQAQMPQPQAIIRTDDDDMEEEADGEFRVNGNGLQGAGGGGERQQAQGGFGLTEPQPYVNGAAENDDEGGEGLPVRDSGNGVGPRFQGQGQGQRQDGQGHFRRRRFRDRYGERDNRERNGTGERTERTDVEGRPDPSSEPSED
jgi:uncharacterized protein DUF4167